MSLFLYIPLPYAEYFSQLKISLRENVDIGQMKLHNKFQTATDSSKWVMGIKILALL